MKNFYEMNELLKENTKEKEQSIVWAKKAGSRLGLLQIVHDELKFVTNNMKSPGRYRAHSKEKIEDVKKDPVKYLNIEKELNYAAELLNKLRSKVEKEIS